MPKQNRLTEHQQQIVEENMGLVGKVITERVLAPDKLGLFTRGDLFQIGCEGLCKAAASFKDNGKGQFSTFAYRVIHNHIIDAMRYSTLRSSREIVTDQVDQDEYELPVLPGKNMFKEVYAILDTATLSASGPIRNGAKALVMRADGFSAKEICKTLDASPSKVRMWISRARKYLINDPDLAALAAGMDL